MLQGFTRCAPNTPYTSPSSVPVHRTISPGLFGPVHQIRLAAPFTSTVLRPRLRNCPPSSSPLPFSILASHPRSPSSSPEPSSVPSPSFVLHPRLRHCPPSSSPEPSSLLVPVTVLHLRHLNRPPSPFSALFTGFVSVTVLHPRPRNCSPSSSPLPFSILASHPRSPSSSPELFSILVFSPVHRIRLRNRSPSSFSTAQFFLDVTKKVQKNVIFKQSCFFQDY